MTPRYHGPDRKGADKVKLLYHGHLWNGSTARQRFEAFQRQPNIIAVPLDIGSEYWLPGLVARVRWKLRWPVDQHRENERLIQAVAAERPDVVFVDNNRVVSNATLVQIRKLCNPLLVYYSPDDIVARHNLSWPVRFTFPQWDVFFTTKTINVAELSAMGVRNPVLVGNAFDPLMHRPMSAQEVGADFERFDVVFVGTVEEDRFRSLKLLADAGYSIAIYGNPASRRGRKWTAMTGDRIRIGKAAVGMDYARHMHHGKLAMCFLRKLNRDRITTRSIEIAGMGRPMIAEKTDEHDSHFVDGTEYLGFRNDAEMVEKVRLLMSDDALRSAIAGAGRARCFAANYQTDARGRDMVDTMARSAAGRRKEYSRAKHMPR